jgi:transcriptional regulator with XRE-family HTH domain
MSDAVPVLAQTDFQVAAGARLRKLIDLLGLSYVEAASLMGVSKHVLRNWMAGDNPPGVYAVYRLARAKGVDFNYVFLGDWSALPSRLAKELDAEMTATLAASEGPDPKAHEKT